MTRSLQRLAVVTLLYLPAALACDCGEPTVQDAFKRADIVFTGKIAGFAPATKLYEEGKAPGDTGKMVVFRVSRVWKGKVSENFEMHATFETAGCWGFSDRTLVAGADLLVYAFWSGGIYQTSLCSRTNFMRYKSEDLKVLGPGVEPRRAKWLFGSPELK